MVFDPARQTDFISAMTLKKWEQKIKKLGLQGIVQSAPRPRGRRRPDDLPSNAKILVIRLDDRIGNAVLITPLLISLKKQFPRGRLFCLLSRRFFGLREFIPAVDEFIPYDKRSYARNPLKLGLLIKSLHQEQFDLVIDASDERVLSFNHAVTTAYSGGRYRVGYDRQGSSHWLEVPVPPGDPHRHAVQMHLDLLRALFTIDESPRPTLLITRPNSFGTDFRARHAVNSGQPLVVIHPGGRGPKRWPLSRFSDLAEQIFHRLSARPVFVWGPAEDEMMGSVNRTLPEGILLAGVLEFTDLVSLLRSSQAYVSNDNGIMHVASACGVPTIGIFTVSEVNKYHPLGPLDCAFDESSSPVKTSDIIEALRGILSRQKTAKSRQ
jgi:heptosyltransferase-3